MPATKAAALSACASWASETSAATPTTTAQPACSSKASRSRPGTWPWPTKRRLGWPSSPAKASQEELTSASISSRSGLTSVTRPPAGGATSVLDVSSMRSTGRSSEVGASAVPIGRARQNLKESPETCTASLKRVSVEELIRSRRTHKAYDPQPVDHATLEALFELARWAPNHNLTNPWRFRVLGPQALPALKAAAGPEAAVKLDRAPTLVAASVVRSEDPVVDEEDFAAGAVATFIVLLGAHARGLGGYWRTPGVLRTPEGRAACGIPDSERVLGLVHLGRAKGPDKAAPERAPLDDIRAYLS